MNWYRQSVYVAVFSLHQVCIETYICSCHQRSINTAVRATLSQMLSDLTLQLRQRQENTVSLSDPTRPPRSASDSVSSHDECPTSSVLAPPLPGLLPTETLGRAGLVNLNFYLYQLSSLNMFLPVSLQSLKRGFFPCGFGHRVSHYFKTHFSFKIVF